VAEKIGLEAGEFIVKISSGDKFVFKKTAKEYRDFLKNNPENLKIVYQKDYKKNRIYRTKEFDLIEKDGKKIAGFYLADTEFIKMPIHKALYYGAIES
jgi:thymidylate synthase